VLIKFGVPNQIERHTFGMLQCHPHPGDFSDKTRPFHHCYFMGLQRKQGVPAHEGEQFDIRATVEEFKHSVGMYTLWKTGMEIQVSHIKRRNVPLFVFPGGVRPSRPPRGEGQNILKAKVPRLTQPSKPVGDKSVDMTDVPSRRNQFDAVAAGGDQFVECPNMFMSSLGASSTSSLCTLAAGRLDTKLFDGLDSNGTVDMETETRKRKHVEDAMASNSADAKRPDFHSETIPPETVPTVFLGPGAAEATGASFCAKEAEALAIKNLTSSPSPNPVALPDEELEDLDLPGKAKDFGVAANSCPVAKDVTLQAGRSCSTHNMNGALEELEVLTSCLLITNVVAKFNFISLILIVDMLSLFSVYFHLSDLESTSEINLVCGEKEEERKFLFTVRASQL